MGNNIEQIVIRPSGERGFADHGWLKTHHSFSFADYYDPEFMGYRSLRVMNEDYVQGGNGFGKHPHKDMEILTYVLEGALEHKDSMGNTSVIKAGDVQKMSAGKGVFHSEFNHSKAEQVHLLQIWILPQEQKITPSYQQFSLPKSKQKEPLLLIGSPDGGDQIVLFHQDVYIYRGVLAKGQKCNYALKAGRGAWIQMIQGSCGISGKVLNAGDGAAIEGKADLDIQSNGDSEFLLFDLK